MVCMTLSKIVNGASLKPRSGEPPKKIVLLLHGFGSNGTDMIALAPAWQELLPDTLFLAPHAPQRCGMMGRGYQWWGLSGFAPSALTAGAASAAPAIDAFIDRKLAQYGLTEADLALVGFSQGTMMALQIGLRRPRAVAAVVGYSGMLAGTVGLGHEGDPKPPVLLVHGTADPVVPIVRRQNIWHNSWRRSAECGPRLGLMFRRRACSVASADVRVSFA